VIVCLGIGSNIDPETNLPKALNLLVESVTVLAISTHYRTAPLAGRAEQADYINGVWQIETERSCENLKMVLQEIETACGRVRSEDKYASRPIDLDILAHGDFIDEDIFTRPFLTFPLMELNPTNSIIAQICRSMQKPKLQDTNITKKLQKILFK